MDFVKRLEEKEAELKDLDRKIENAVNERSLDASGLDNWKSSARKLRNQLTALYDIKSHEGKQPKYANGMLHVGSSGFVLVMLYLIHRNCSTSS